MCSTKVNFVDRQGIQAAIDVNCFMENLTHVEAMAFDVYGEMVFFSDTAEHKIYRLHMESKPLKPEVVVANTGTVKGMVTPLLYFYHLFLCITFHKVGVGVLI